MTLVKVYCSVISLLTFQICIIVPPKCMGFSIKFPFQVLSKIKITNVKILETWCTNYDTLIRHIS